MAILNRRSFFGRLAAGAAATSIAAAAAIPAQGPKPIIGPLSPDEYIAELEALGMSLRAVIVVDRAGNVIHGPQGYAEYWNGRQWDLTDDEIIRERQVRRAAGHGSSGTDASQFGRRVGARLYQPGKFEYAGPYGPTSSS